MVFVAGGTGYLGSHLLYNLLLLGKPVRAIYRDKEKLDYFLKFRKFYPAVTDQELAKIEWVKGDILDYYTISEYLTGITQVYHVAGMVSFQREDKKRMFSINVEGTANIVNACLEKSISRLCYVSSISALGDSRDSELIDENHTWKKNSGASPYSYCKFRGEMEVWRGIHEGLQAVIVNPSVIIGPGMWFGSFAGIFEQIRKGLNYYPTGTTGFVDVSDVARIMIRLTESGISGERFILSAENLSLHDVLEYLARALKKTPPAHALTPLLIKAACQFEKIRSFFTGRIPRITRQSMRSSTAVTAYSNEKLLQTLSLKYTPVRESLASSVRYFLDEKAENS